MCHTGMQKVVPYLGEIDCSQRDLRNENELRRGGKTNLSLTWVAKAKTLAHGNVHPAQ